MDKEFFIDKLRTMSCIAVVFLHVISGQYINGFDNIPVYRVIFDTAILRSIVNFAVPVFVMITGYLLLDPKREVNSNKIKKYILRMIFILLTVGYAYCLIETIVSNNNNFFQNIWISFYNLLSGNSWSHMWYIYMLIGLYLFIIPLRIIINNMDFKDVKKMMIILFVLTMVIPTINKLFNLNITTFYIEGLKYILYLIIGYEIKNFNIPKYINLLTMIISLSIIIIYSTCFIQFPNIIHDYSNPILLIYSVSIFYYIYKYKNDNNKNSKIINFISENSLNIYLFHPLFLNIIYKFLKVYQTNLPIIVGELTFFTISFTFSILLSVVIKKIPYLKNYF